MRKTITPTSGPAWAALLSLLLLCGCQVAAPLQAGGDDDNFQMGATVALYASADEAAAVARGDFGAWPVALVPEAELEAVTGCPGALPRQPTADAQSARADASLCMRNSKSGRLGWLPAAPARPAPPLPSASSSTQAAR